MTAALVNALRAAAAKHAAAVNAAAGEPLRLLPQRKGGRGGGAGGADTGRPAVEFVGTVTMRPAMLQRVGNGAQGGTNPQFNDAKWQVGFPAALRLPDGSPPEIRDGDHVERLDPGDGEPIRFRLYAPLSIRGRTIHPADPV